MAGQASDQCGPRLASPSTGVVFDASQTEAQPERGTCPRLTATETALPARVLYRRRSACYTFLFKARIAKFE